MKVDEFIRQLEGDYGSERLLVEYIAGSAGWRTFNDKYVWRDFSALPVSAQDFANLYFQKPRRFLRFLHSLSLSTGPLPIELGPQSVAFVPLRNHNAHCCLAPDGSPVILIDVFLERTLGELCAALTTFMPNGPAYPRKVTGREIATDEYANALKRLSGSSDYEVSGSIFDQLLCESASESADWHLAHEYQDAMLFFILLHELAHYINGDVGAFAASMLEGAAEDASTMSRVASTELGADTLAWNIWTAAANSDDVNMDATFQLDFLQERGGAPGILFRALEQGHSLFRDQSRSFGHATPRDRFENFLSTARLRQYSDMQLANDTLYPYMLTAVGDAGRWLSEQKRPAGPT